MENKNMGIGEAIGIFSNIDDEIHSDKEKAMAILIVLNRPGIHRLVVKNDMMEVIRWLWNRQFRAEKSRDGDGKKQP